MPGVCGLGVTSIVHALTGMRVAARERGGVVYCVGVGGLDVAQTRWSLHNRCVRCVHGYGCV